MGHAETPHEEQETGEVLATYYWVPWGKFLEDGTFVVKTSEYTAEEHRTGYAEVKPDAPDYPLWQSLVRRREAGQPRSYIISDKDLDDLRAEFKASAACQEPRRRGVAIGEPYRPKTRGEYPAAQGWVKVVNGRAVPMFILLEPWATDYELAPGDECYVRLVPDGDQPTLRLTDEILVAFCADALYRGGVEIWEFSDLPAEPGGGELPPPSVADGGVWPPAPKEPSS